MKVKVNVKISPKVQEKYYEQVIAEAYAEMEVMFQENKDLRDDLACAKAQIKAWSSKYATVCADRDNLEAAYKQVQESLTQMVRNFDETRKELENEVKRVCKEKQDLYAQLADKDEEFAELQTEYNELNEDYDELAKAKREYAEEIDRLRHENKGLRNQMPLPEFMRQFIEMTREAVRNEFPDSGNS
jgi:chromosome segregation ATPase